MPRRKKVRPYLLNLASMKLHRRPTQERCNADQITRRRDLRGRDKIPVGVFFCRHCYPEGFPDDFPAEAVKS